MDLGVLLGGDDIRGDEGGRREFRAYTVWI